MSSTTAALVAEMLGNDGQQWEAEDGRDLETICMDEGAERYYGRTYVADSGDGGPGHYEVEDVTRSSDDRDMVRYEFDDGSAIVAALGGWDIEGADRWSWEGA